MVGVQDLAWSADGGSLYFSAMRVKRDYSDYTPQKWAVYRYDVSSGQVGLLAASSFSVSACPPGPFLIVGALVSGNRDLYLLDESGRRIARLTTDSTEDFAGACSPDGRRIAFTTKRGGRAEVYVANRDGSGAHRLIDAGADRTYNPSWSPDGRHIAYYREKGDGQDQVFIVGADGSGPVNVTNDAYNNVYPAWTPDGRVVYGQGSKNSPTRAFTVSTDGAEKRPLLDIKGFFTRYSPDGSRIAYVAEPQESPLRVVIADTLGRVLTVVPLDAVKPVP
jgi:TolB protein